MKKIMFATGNARKIGEARAACKDFGIEVEQVKLDIDEIQARDPIKITKHKAAEAFRQLKKPVVVGDGDWSIYALNGFPGGYMKDVQDWFSSEDFIKLVEGKDDRRISFTETIIYKDAKMEKVFSREFVGRITDFPRGKGNSVERIAEFDGFTIAEKHDMGEFSHDPKDYIWYEFAEWFVGKDSGK